MASKIKLFLLEREDADSNFIGRVDAVDAERYVFLRLWLEEFGVVDWPFNSWDVEAKCRMKGKLEGMTTVDPKIYVILCLSEDGAPRSCCLAVGNMGDWFDRPSSLDTSDHTRAGDVLVKLPHVWPQPSCWRATHRPHDAGAYGAANL
jgi:hypothetical protein